jgi:hypothetical protein
MSKKSKIIYSVVAVIAIILIGVVMGMLVKKGADVKVEEGVADVEAIKLPKAKELKSILGKDIQQTDKLTDEYVLRNYTTDETDKSITYFYQTHLATNGERLMLKAKSMTEDEFKTQYNDKNTQTENYAALDLTFVSKTLYSVPDDYTVPEAFQSMVDEGIAEIEYGNDMVESIGMQRMYWYEDGVGYTLTAYYHNFTFEDMAEIVHYFIDNRK